MDLYQKILTGLLADYPKAKTEFPDLFMNENEIVEEKCRKTLQKIKAVIEDDSFEKPDSITKIEEIIWRLEDLVSAAGIR